jgi:uncharacterized protein (DUF2141 family)
MKAKKISTFLILTLVTICWKCATITTPEGGPKDVTPPTLLRSNPKQNEKNFKEKTLQLYFNETLKLKNPKEEIIITPSPGKEIEFITKGNNLIINPKENWKDSTTYSISFREAVQDITEGNFVPNLRLAFSTGAVIDSLIIKGTVKEALTEKIPENITVAIYTQDTFNIFKHNPIYFTKIDKTGAFKIENLKQGKYLIYAFEDKNKNLKVDSQTEKFGFLSDTVQLKKDVNGLTIPLIRIDTRNLKLTSARSIQDLVTIRFNKAIVTYKIKTENNSYLHNSFGDDQTKVSVLINEEVKDSIKIKITAQDSLLQKVDTSLYIKRTPVKRTKDQFKISFSEVEIDSVSATFKAHFKANKIISHFKLDSMRISLDSSLYVQLTRKDIVYDSINKRGSLKKELNRKDISTKKQKFTNLILGKNFVSTIEDDSVKRQTINSKILTNEETGTLITEVTNKTKYNFILELLNQDNKVIRTVYNEKIYSLEGLNPGTYKLRITIDKNCNGKWDYGNILLREEPEPTFIYKTLDKKFEFPIRANWEVGPYRITF